MNKFANQIVKENSGFPGFKRAMSGPVFSSDPAAFSTASSCADQKRSGMEGEELPY